MQSPHQTPEEEIAHLRQLNNTKSDLISISAHELRTSLSALKWILKMFIDEDTGPISAEQRELLEKASASNERMITLVNDMLTLSHEEDVRISYKFAPLDIVELMDNVLFDFTGESYKRGVELIFLKPDTKVPMVSADAGKLRVVFQNLIENAIKYCKEGDRIIITITEENGQAVVSVKDTGIGIPKADQSRIFEKFFRAGNAEKKEYVGSGLGLFTIKSIVEKHGGTLSFESTEGAGTTFFARLPIEGATVANA